MIDQGIQFFLFPKKKVEFLTFFLQYHLEMIGLIGERLSD